MVFVSGVFLSIIVSHGSDHILLDSHLLEFIWTVIPMFFLVFIALPSLYLLYLIEDIGQCALTVKVIAHQWFWEYEYFSSDYNFNSYIKQYTGDSVRLLDVDNRLVLSNLVPVTIMVTSADVLHSWAVPRIGLKVDAIPGRINYLNLTPNSFGIFYGQCSELCGSNHSFIPIVLEVASPKGIITYLDSIKR